MTAACAEYYADILSCTGSDAVIEWPGKGEGQAPARQSTGNVQDCQPAQAGQQGWGRWLDCRGTTLISTCFIAGKEGLAERCETGFTGQRLSGIQFNMVFLHFRYNRMTKEASDTMLVAVTGCADAFWRASAWYLSILVDVLPQPGRGQVRQKWRKWRNML